MEQRLLVVEDDKYLREIIADYFGSKGFAVETAPEGEAALALLETRSYCLILLDVMLPGINGFRICRRIREVSDVPVIFVTARVQEEDELNGYSMGADDYVTKPFSLPVLHAKVQALLSRMQGKTQAVCMKCKNLSIDVKTREVWIEGNRCSMPPKEYEILLFFLENPNRVYSREQLLIRFWGYDFEGSDRVVDNHIKKLRKLLGTEGRHICTVRKAGYKWEVEV